jgi:plasmid maintenance system killer protein
MMPTHHFTSPMTQQPLLPTGPHHSFPATSTALAASTLAAMTSSTAAATLSNPASTHYEGVPSVEAALVSMRQQRAQRARTALSQQVFVSVRFVVCLYLSF